MRFASKAELLEQIEEEHDRFIELLEAIPTTQRREPGVWGDGWTAHDLVAHLMEWQLMFLRWFREGREGGRPEIPAPGYKCNRIPELNRVIWSRHRRAAHARIRREFERSYAEIRALVIGLAPTELLEPGHFAWTGKNPLTTYLAPNTCCHYRFAIRILKRRLRRDRVPLRESLRGGQR